MESLRMRLWMASRVTPKASAASATLRRSTDLSSDTPYTPIYSHGGHPRPSGLKDSSLGPRVRSHHDFLPGSQALASASRARPKVKVEPIYQVNPKPISLALLRPFFVRR